VDGKEDCWLYLKEQPVVCDRMMELGACIAAINPAISSYSDSVECGLVQQRLLCMFYNAGHLDKYPLALGEFKKCCVSFKL